MQALAHANRVRSARAELRRLIKAGEVDIGEVLEPRNEIPWEAESMPIGRLLAAQYRWGGARAGKLLARLDIAEHRAVGELTSRQRASLVAALRGETAPRQPVPSAPQAWISGWGPEVLW
jgi:hypothetical protein